MLIKLFKHEWKATWKLPTGLIVFLMIVSVVAGATFASPVWKSGMEDLEILLGLVGMLYYFAIIGASLGIVIYMAVHFYKSMYTDEGYLTHTLPVTSHQLLIAKVLPIIIWSALAIIGIGFSLCIFVSMALNYLQPDLTIMEMIASIREAIDEKVILLLLSIVFLGICGLLSGSMMIAGSITIGQLVRKHKILGAIGAYIAISTAVQVFATVVMIPFMSDKLYASNSIYDVMTLAYFCIGVGAFVIAVALYFISEFIIRRKLNLD